MKAQILTDFIAECTWGSEEGQLRAEEKEIIEDSSEFIWMLHVDGASNANGCGASLILANPSGQVIEYALQFSFQASNQAEYEALIAGLRIS